MQRVFMCIVLIWLCPNFLSTYVSFNNTTQFGFNALDPFFKGAQGIETKLSNVIILFLAITSIVKYGTKSNIRSKTTTVQPFDFKNGVVISSHTLLDMWFLSIQVMFA